MRWTPHMEDTLEYLAKSPEVFGDEQLAAMARALRIGEDVLTASGWRFFEPEAYAPPKPPPMVLVKALRSNLDALRLSLRPEITGNSKNSTLSPHPSFIILLNTTFSSETIRAYLEWTDAMINELPLLHRPAPKTGPGWIDFDRAECFHACVEALRRFIDAWLVFEQHDIFGMFMGLGLHFAQATHIVYRLSMAPTSSSAGAGEDPGWDRESVRNAIDLPRILTEGADKFASISEVVGLETEDGEEDAFIATAVSLRRAAETWGKAFADTETRRPTDAAAAFSSEVTGGAMINTTAITVSGGAGEGVANGEDVPMMDFSAGFWMPDLFESWDSM